MPENVQLEDLKERVVQRESLKRTWYSPCFCALRRMYTLWNFPVNTALPSLAQMYCFVTPSNMHVRWPRFSQAIRALTAPTSMGNIMYCWTHHKRFHVKDKATILAKIFGTLGYFWKHFQYIYFRPLFPQLNVLDSVNRQWMGVLSFNIA